MATGDQDPGRGGMPIETGRASERTGLAWSRSALSIAATGGLLAKAAADEGASRIGATALGVLLLFALAVWAYGAISHRRGGIRSPRLALALISAASAAAGAAAFLLVLLA